MLQFPIAMTPRTEPARALAWLSPVIAFALTVFTGFCLFAALGQDPVKALGVFFIAPLDSLRGWTEIAVKMTPLLLCAAGLVVCFKANVWNIGAEGQLIAGAITGGVVALACDPSWGRWYVVLVMLASAAGGAVWGGFTALLRHSFCSLGAYRDQCAIPWVLVSLRRSFLKQGRCCRCSRELVSMPVRCWRSFLRWAYGS